MLAEQHKCHLQHRAYYPVTPTSRMIRITPDANGLRYAEALLAMANDKGKAMAENLVNTIQAQVTSQATSEMRPGM